MFAVEKFLTIFELETGAKFIGYFGLISCSVILTLCIFVLTKVFTDFDLVEESLHSIQMEKNLAINPEAVDLLRHTLIASLVSLIFLQIISLMAFTLLVRSVKTRNPKQLNPSVLLFLMFTVLAFLGLLSRFSASSIVNLVLNFYILVMLQSLKKKFQEEQRGGRVQFLPPTIMSDYDVMVQHYEQQEKA